jgi:hypothetical protein
MGSFALSQECHGGRFGRTSADADDLRQIGGAEDGEDGSQR